MPHEIGDLYYYWRESGFLSRSIVDYSVSAEVTVTVGCRADGLITTTDTYDGPGYLNHPVEIAASRRGVVHSSADFRAAAGGACPTGENRVLLAITYADGILCDDINGRCTLLGGETLTDTVRKDGVNPRNCPLF